MVHANAAVDLVVQADLSILAIVIPAQLNAVHPQIRLHHARSFDVLPVDLRQGNERPAVRRPTLSCGN